MIEKILRAERITKFLPYIRSFAVLRSCYVLSLPNGKPSLLRVDEFDGDLNSAEEGHFTPTERLKAGQKLPEFCNLWVCRFHSLRETA